MKTKLLMLLLGILLSHTTNGQGMPVYDNTNFLTLGKSLIESAKQTSELLKTVEFLKAQKERIEQVNNVIRQLRLGKEIIENNQLLFEMVRDDLEEIVNSPYIRADEAEWISQSFDLLMKKGAEDLEFMQQILTSNFLNMTDSQRLEILMKQKERSREMLSDIRYKKKRYEDIISFREFREKVNNREFGF